MGQSLAHERCIALLDQIEIPDPFDIEQFADIVGQHRGRPVQLRPILNAEPPAYCVPKAEADVVCYDAGTGNFHRDHLVLHELGHLLFEHDPLAFWDGEAPELLPDLDIDVIRSRMFARATFDCPSEQEAELFATLVQESVWRRERVQRPRGVAAQLTRALGSQARRHA